MPHPFNKSDNSILSIYLSHYFPLELITLRKEGRRRKNSEIILHCFISSLLSNLKKSQKEMGLPENKCVWLYNAYNS